MTTEARATNLVEQFEQRNRRSRELYARAKAVFPSGVTHDNRYSDPFPIYITRAQGSRKWDVDGNEYVDFWSGHGALILGHGHPAVTSAVVAQAQKGTHYGACHELEIRWGELVQEIVPSAELVRFFSSGTEATMMALRLARAFTGREKIVKIQGHFHGWHDYATVAMAEPYEVPVARGIPRAVNDSIIPVPPKDIAAVERALSENDVAGVILVCNSTGTEYLQKLRDLTRARGAILIFDEVVTGFRYAPGGCQEYYGVTPDLTTLAKILAGGYPGAAVGGRADLLNQIEFRDDEQYMRYERVPHQGTFNANPISAAAGIACLEIVRDPQIQQKATAVADTMRASSRETLTRRGVDGTVGGEVSLMSIGLKGKVGGRKLNLLARAAMQLNGVDLTRLDSIITTAVHTDEDIERFNTAFDRALGLLQTEGVV